MELEVRKPRPSKNQINQYVNIRTELAAKLRAKALQSPAFSSLCHMLAMRERSRSQITLRNLGLTMAKEGFTYKIKDHEDSLLFLASLGIGNLDKDLKGNIRSLKGIKFSLQNIGLAAISTEPLIMPEQSKYPVERKPYLKEEVNLEIKVFGKTFTIKTSSEEAINILTMIVRGK